MLSGKQGEASMPFTRQIRSVCVGGAIDRDANVGPLDFVGRPTLGLPRAVFRGSSPRTVD